MKELRALQEEPIRGLIHELVDEVLKEQAETPTDAQNEANEPAPDVKYLAEQQMGSALLDHRCDAEVEMRPTDINEPTESPTAVCNAGLDAPKSAA